MTLRAKKYLIDRAAKHMEWADDAKKRASGHLYDAYNTIGAITFINLQREHLNEAKRYEKLSAYCEQRAMQILKQL